jgi:hypothetical protein
MSRTTTTLTTALAIGAAGAVGLGATAVAAPETGSQKSRAVPISATVDGFPAGKAQGKVRLNFPIAWKARTSATALTITKSTPACTYKVTAKADYVVGDKGADTAPLVEAAAPAKGPYLLDHGTRGTTSWRVTRVQDGSTRTRLVAVRMAPTAITAGTKAPLPAGKQFFLRTTVRAIDGADDECHTGTYRQSLGPAIGDALVTQKGSGFIQPK